MGRERKTEALGPSPCFSIKNEPLLRKMKSSSPAAERFLVVC